ncbi:YbjN domain-containing protein [Beijerinckia mobilis]|uniref:YbjN domain-containing protein n=1 Tax=Beijerinckia mobilis TaxID=231434 RepID=UPI00055952A5|nr:YbjN domain-containing protein [Beijerinckia mobilis]
MAFPHFAADRSEHPVDLIERLAAQHQWAFDRDGEDELSISVTGEWTDYNVAFTWLADMEALHIACVFDLKIPPARGNEVLSLIALINEQLWLGHFDIWPQDGVIMFRHTIVLAGGADLNGRQCETVLTNAVVTCERYYQAFQFVVWAGRSSREALEQALIVTQGRA